MQYPAQEIDISAFDGLGREEIMRHEFDLRTLVFRRYSIIHDNVLHDEI
jgi:hypothetical protein